MPYPSVSASIIQCRRSRDHFRTTFRRLAEHGRALALVCIVLSVAGPIRAQAPTITIAPLSKLTVAGQSVSLTVTATGPGPLAYTWIRNGQVISGASSATLNIASVGRSDSGWYQAVVSNSTGSTRSVFGLTVAPEAGAVIGWGDNYPYGQSVVPAGLGRIAAIAAGAKSYVLRANGSVATWGEYSITELFPANVVAIAGFRHVLALKIDGTVGGADDNFYGQSTIPAGLSGVVAVAAGMFHSLALKSNGTLVAWGNNDNQQTQVPANANDIVAIAAGTSHNLALRANGTVVAWGRDADGQCTVPPGLSGVIAVAAGGSHSLALRNDGTVVAWGSNAQGQCTLPSGLAGVVAISAGAAHNLALRSDGMVVGWGENTSAKATAPDTTRNAYSIAAGTSHSLALAPATGPAITTQPVNQSVAPGGAFMLEVAGSGTRPFSYRWKKDGMALADTANRISGSSSRVLTITDAQTTDAGRYTVEVSNPANTITSMAAVVVVANPPTITARSLSRVARVGESLTLSVTAEGTAPLSYQWRRNNQTIPSVSTSTLTIASAALTDRGYYEVIVTGGNGGVARSVCQVNVTSVPFAFTAVREQPGWNGVPEWLQNPTVISAGSNLSLAVQSDGAVAEWGFAWGVFHRAHPPEGINGVVAVSAANTSGLALRADGTIAPWSVNQLPAGLRDLVAVAAGEYYNLALTSDGRVVEWYQSWRYDGADLDEVGPAVAIAAGQGGIALRPDGTVKSWRMPSAAPPAGLNNVIAIAAGSSHYLALKSDGTVVGWGSGAAAVIPAGLSNVIAISAGYRHSLALKADGRVTAWGENSNGQVTAADNQADVIAISAGSSHSLTLVSVQAPSITSPPAPQLAIGGSNATLAVAASGSSPIYYQWYKDGAEIPGATGSSYTLLNVIEADAGLYKVKLWNSGGTVTSGEAALSVQEPNTAPVIRRAPASVARMGADAATFSVVPGGASPRTIQWYYGISGDTSQPIAGATGFNVTVSSATHSQRLWARITNSLGTIDTPSVVALRWEQGNPGFGDNDLVIAGYENGRYFLGSPSYFGWSGDTQTWSKLQSSSHALTKVAYGNGIYVKIGTPENDVQISSNGTNWTQARPYLTNLSGIVFNGTLFIAIRSDNRIYTSPDGANWTERIYSAQQFVAIAFGSGKVVVAGNGGAVYSSTDGIQWTERTLPTRLNLLIHANNRFVLASHEGDLWSSTDALLWTQRSGFRGNALTGGGGLYLSADYVGELRISSDLDVWSSLTGLWSYRQCRFAYGNGRFLATIGDGKFLRSLPIPGAITLENVPAEPAVIAGTGITLRVTAGGGDLRYQWYRGAAGDLSQPIAGATSASYTTPPLNERTPYWVRVSNTIETVASATFEVILAAMPSIGQSPSSLDILAESPITLTAAASGPPTPSYQWYLGSTANTSQPIAGATVATFTAPPQPLSANYWARAATLLGTADTETAAVTRWEVRNDQVVPKQFTYFKGRYFVATDKLLSSVDGRLWEEVSAVEWPASVTALVHDGAKLVVLGYDYIATSTDGIAFTRGTAGWSGDPGSGGIHANGTFVIPFGYGFIWSADAVTWAFATYDGFTPQSAPSVAYGNGKFVSAVDTTSRYPSKWAIYTSADGKIWKEQEIDDPGFPYALTSITYGNGLFVVVGNENTLFTSPDGAVWTRRNPGNFTGNRPSIAFGNGVFVIGTSQGECLRSTDGVAWTRQQTPVGFSSAQVAFVNGHFLAGGSTGWLHRSDDGRDWTLLNSGPFLGSADQARDIALGNGRMLSLQSEAGRSTLYISTDGVRWTAGTTPGNIKSRLVFAQGAFTCGGDDGRIYRSADGMTWETFLAGTTGDSLPWLIYNGNQFAALSTTKKIFLSSNGRTWNVIDRYAPQTGPIASSGSVHVLGANRTLYVSTDWRRWSPATLPSSAYRIDQIAYGNGTFVAANWPSERFYSRDGVVWNAATDAGGLSYYGVEFAGGRFLTFGNYGHAWSLDGRDWRANAFDPTVLTARQLMGRLKGLFAASDASTTLIASPPFLQVARRAPTALGIVNSPAGQIIPAGQTATLEVGAAGAGLAYQWFEGASGDTARPVAGATSATFTTPPLGASGDYWVRVTSPGFMQSSATAHVEVLVPPSITTQPADVQASKGSNVSFAVVATGLGSLAYQWNLDGAPIAGATNATYAITDAQLEHAGGYSVMVSSAYGSTMSRTAVLRGANPAPNILTPPQPSSVIAGQNATFSVTATGAGTLSYQWRRNGVPLPGATGSSLLITLASGASVGIYDVVIADGLSMTTSPAARLDVAPPAYPQVLQPDAIFNAQLETMGGTVRGFQRLGDGRVMVFGNFTRVNGTKARHVARLSSNGSVDPTFFTAEPNDTVYAVAPQADGKLLITGAFTRVGNQARAGIARLHGDGSLDDSFVPDLNVVPAYAVTILPDGRIVAGGAFERRLAKFDPSGARETSFAPTLNGAVHALAASPDGGFVAGGAFTAIDGQSRRRIARFRNDGSIDSSFADGGGFNETVYTLSTAPDLRLIAAGAFTRFNGATANRIIRLTSGGQTDATWSSGTGFDGTVYGLDVRIDGRIYAAGAFTTYRGITRRSVARINTNGELDGSYISTAIYSPLLAVSYLGADAVLLGGNFLEFRQTRPRWGLALMGALGTAPDPNFGPGLLTMANTTRIAPLANGDLIVVGDFVLAGDDVRPFITRIRPNGAVDPDFNPGGTGPNSFDRDALVPGNSLTLASLTSANSAVRDVLVQEDGKLLIVGTFYSYNDLPTPYGMGRLHRDGTLDTTFVPAWNSPADWAVPALGGKAYVFGSGVTGYLRRINRDGNLDPGFDPGQSSPDILAAAEQVDRKLVIVGSFTYFNGHRARIVRLLADGTVDASFNAAADAAVRAVALQSDGRILIGGDFLTINGIARPRVARLLNDGSVDLTFSPGWGPNGSVTDIKVQADGQVLLAGDFTRVNQSQGTAFVARLRTDGSVDSTFAVPGLTQRPTSLALLDNGDLALAAQQIDLRGDNLSHSVVRLSSSPGPQIIVQPKYGAWRAGEPLRLSVTVRGGSDCLYQWTRNSAAIPGATEAEFGKSAIQAADAGTYRVRITHSSGTLESTPAMVSVAAAAPVPKDENAMIGFGGAIKSGSRWPLQAPALAAGTAPIAYAWSKDGIPIPGATDALFIPATWQSGDSGDYRVTITNPLGTIVTPAFGQLVSPQPDWDWQAPAPQGNSLTQVSSLNGRILAGGARGTILSSTDATTWSVHRIGVSNTVLGFAWGNGTFVALSSFSGMWSSADGLDWTQRLSGVGHDGRHLRALAFGAGRFVAVGDEGASTWSVDGRNWNAFNAGMADSFCALGYGAGRFVALGSGGRTYISTDGLTWNRGAMLPAETTLLAFGNGRFAAAGENRAFVSIEGTAWTERSLPTSHRVLSLQYTAAGFLGILDSPSLRFCQSSDGLSWTLQSATLTPAAPIAAISFGAGRYVAVGSAPDTLLTSQDGLTWTRPVSVPPRHFVAAAANGSSMAAVAHQSSTVIGLNGAIATTDGISALDTPRDVAFGAGLFVAVGGNGSARIATSPTGSTWTGQSLSSLGELSGVSYLNDRFLALGAGGTLLISTQGTAWTQKSSNTAATLTKAAFGAGTYVVVGSSGTVLTSTDGDTWTLRSAGVAATINDIVYAAGRFVLVTASGDIRSSPDGLSWTGGFNPLRTPLRSVLYANGSFYAFVDGNTNYLVSPDGQVWAAAQHGNANFVRDAVEFNGRLHLVTANGTIGFLGLNAITPAISTPPLPRSSVIGGTLSFSVTANGTGPLFYQWFRNGIALVGENSSTLTLTNVMLADSGYYAVTITNTRGTTSSAPVMLSVSLPPTAPRILTAPASRAVVVGASTTFSVTASGSEPLAYQWRKDGTAIEGATQPSLALNHVQPSDTGAYSVRVANAIGEAISHSASLSLVPAGIVATHQLVRADYEPGTAVTVANTFTSSGAPGTLKWQVLLPGGFTLAASSGDEGASKPAIGSTTLAEWSWSTLPGEVQFSYTLNAPANSSGTTNLAALVSVQMAGEPAQFLAQPDPLNLERKHSADIDRDGQISLLELTRLIELYNTRNGTVRTGCYAVAPAPAEDGFTAATDRPLDASVELTRYHSADFNRDARLDLSELTRVIQLYNFREGSVRTGKYRGDSGTEDGFLPGH